MNEGVPLVPWSVQRHHRWHYSMLMLRAEAMRRSGRKISEQDEARLSNWKKVMSDENKVVAYDPYSEEGFSYVPREAGDWEFVRP